jgi:glycerate dehydrogenase
VSDVLVVSTPLTKATRNLIGERELLLMKPDAILVNLARGEIIQEAPLFAHLQSHPNFFACIDAWWVEPVRHGTFRVDHPFLSLPNVVGSPHNSASVPGMTEAALRRAIVNIRRALAGEAPHYVVGPEERTN